MNDFKYALSWSRLSDYQQCPRKFKLKYVDKAANFQEDDKDKSPHLVRGGNVHKALENYVIKLKAGQVDIPVSSLPEVEATKPLIQNFIKAFGLPNVHPEQQVSVKNDWSQTEWFDRKSYYRAIFDFIALKYEDTIVSYVDIIDWKTGKFKDYSADQPGQLELSAAIALNMWPQAKEVSTRYVYVDHKKTITRKFTAEHDKEYLTMHFVKEHKRVNDDQVFEPTQNEFCKYCQATKLQCQFSRKL